MFDISREHGMEDATHDERLYAQQKPEDVWTPRAASVGGLIGVRALKASSPVGLLVS